MPPLIMFSSARRSNTPTIHLVDAAYYYVNGDSQIFVQLTFDRKVINRTATGVQIEVTFANGTKAIESFDLSNITDYDMIFSSPDVTPSDHTPVTAINVLSMGEVTWEGGLLFVPPQHVINPTLDPNIQF